MYGTPKEIPPQSYFKKKWHKHKRMSFNLSVSQESNTRQSLQRQSGTMTKRSLKNKNDLIA